MDNFWKNPNIVKHSPFVSMFLLEAANFFQLIEMWTHRTAAGQSIFGWVSVNIALLLYLNFYLVCTPNMKSAIVATSIGVVINLMVVLTTIYFKL